MNSMLYIVYGIGSDSVGLVGAITAPMSKVGGNIVDMRQDVLHGLFTIYLVVDLAKATVSVDEFSRLVDKISADTGLKLAMEKFTPVSPGSEKKNILLTLVGKGQAGNHRDHLGKARQVQYQYRNLRCRGQREYLPHGPPVRCEPGRAARQQP